MRIPWETAGLILLLTIPFAVGGSGSVEYLWLDGCYDLYLGHAHTRETMLVRFEDEIHLLGGQTLVGLEGISNVTLSCPNREVNWSYDGSILEWSYLPPLQGGEAVILTREWDVGVTPDADGFRDLTILGTPTGNSSLLFRTHDVDLIESSLPLNDDLEYRGNLSSTQYVCYSSRYKLYTYSWEVDLTNPGLTPTEVDLNISVPRSDGFQCVLDLSETNIASDELGNPIARKRLLIEPGLSETVSLQATVLTTTWTGGMPGLADVLGNPLLYLGSDPSYWRLEDAAISTLASSLLGGIPDPEGKVQVLSSAVEGYLDYVTMGDRRGASWAVANLRGSCMEHSDLFIACARWAGIPSLYLSGYCGSGQQGEAGHAWVAVWLADAGWVGIDPTWSRTRSLDSGRLVMRVCNPDDYGVSVVYSGGSVNLEEKGARWSFEELTSREAERLLGIGEPRLMPLVLLVIFTEGVARITRRWPRS